MKTVIITGAAKGIGKACAKLFDENGYNVCINYKSSKNEAELLAKSLKSAIAIQGDISIREDCERIVNNTISSFGSIDVLINNAGIALPQSLITDTTQDEFDNVFDINIKGIYLLTNCILPYMINKKKGSIVNISSLWGVSGASCEVIYSASKAAVIGFTKALAKEVGPSGVRVNAVAPGFVLTDMNKHLSEDEVTAFAEDTPLCKVGSPEEIAEAVYFLASEKASFITGQTICVDGGYTI